MRKAYFIFRILGYAAGAAGLFLFIIGSRSMPPKPELQMAGGILLIVMFSAFVVTYVLYVVARLRRNRAKSENRA